MIFRYTFRNQIEYFFMSKALPQLVQINLKKIEPYMCKIIIFNSFKELNL